MRMLGLAPLVLVVAGSACDGTLAHTGPTPVAPSPTAPVPAGASSGRIDSLEVAADLITFNQAANIGFSIPVEGAIERSPGLITRWELPIPVHVDPSIQGSCVEDAMDYWQSVTGVSHVWVASDAEPRITVRAAGSDELNVSAGSGLVYRTYADNRARLGVVKILTSSAICTAPSALFRHELGHVLGIFGHPPGGLMSSPLVGMTASQREIGMLRQLYRLPHGSRIASDGAWAVQ
jgi:hypothetical protein